MPFTEAMNNRVLNHLFGNEELVPFQIELAILLRNVGDEYFFEPTVYDVPASKYIIDPFYKRILLPSCHWSKAKNGIIQYDETILFNKFKYNYLVWGVGLYEHPNHDTLLGFTKYEGTGHQRYGKWYPKGSHVIIHPGNLKIRLR